MKVGPCADYLSAPFQKRASPFVMTYSLGDLKLFFLILKHFYVCVVCICGWVVLCVWGCICICGGWENGLIDTECLPPCFPPCLPGRVLLSVRESPTELGVPASAALVRLLALGHFLIKNFYLFIFDQISYVNTVVTAFPLLLLAPNSSSVPVPQISLKFMTASYLI